jgi:hypothetical protein
MKIRKLIGSPVRIAVPWRLSAPRQRSPTTTMQRTCPACCRGTFACLLLHFCARAASRMLRME